VNEKNKKINSVKTDEEEKLKKEKEGTSLMSETLGNNKQKKRQSNKKIKKKQEKQNYIGLDGDIIYSNFKNKNKASNKSPLWQKKKKKQDPSMIIMEGATTTTTTQKHETNDSTNLSNISPSSIKDQFWKTSTEDLIQSNLLRSTCTVEYFTRVNNFFLFFSIYALRIICLDFKNLCLKIPISIEFISHQLIFPNIFVSIWKFFFYPPHPLPPIEKTKNVPTLFFFSILLFFSLQSLVTF
jgi:hypothetical protein